MNRILNNLLKNRKISENSKTQISTKIQNLLKIEKFNKNQSLYLKHIKDMHKFEKKMLEYRIGIYKDEKAIRKSVARHVGLNID